MALKKVIAVQPFTLARADGTEHIHPFGVTSKDGALVVDEKDISVFAVLPKDLDTANKYDEVTESEANLLLGYKHVMPYDTKEDIAAAQEVLNALLKKMAADQANADLIAGTTRKPPAQELKK